MGVSSMKKKVNRPNKYRAATSDGVMAKFNAVRMERSERLTDYENYRMGNLVTSVKNYWKDWIEENLPEYCPFLGFTGRETGQIKTLVNRLSDGGIDPLAVISYALLNWNTFTAHCERQHSAFKSPPNPEIRYVLLYSQGLVTFFNKQQSVVGAEPTVEEIEDDSDDWL